MPTVAAIDVGTNAMRMMIARANGDRPVEVLANVREAIRLGQDVFTKRVISEELTSRAVEAFIKFRALIDRHSVQHIKAVGTSAMRDALNRDIFIDRITKASGIEILVIGAEEEARLIHIAVAERIDLKNKLALLIDIGGGSVEVTLVSDDSITATHSFNMGTVRLLQKLEPARVGESHFNQLVHEYADATNMWLETRIGKQHIDLCAATGGNVESLGDLRMTILRKESRSPLAAKELDALAQKLQSMTFEQRLQDLGLRPDRADVIVPAVIVLQTLLKQAGLSQVLIPNVGLKDGLLLDVLRGLYDHKNRLHRDQVLASAMQLGNKYAFDTQHATTVARIATQLFDDTRTLHDLDDEARLLLEAAALLHDIGHFINTSSHHKHTYYLITSSPIIGLSESQKFIIANIARYHRKSTPNLDHDSYRSLSPKDRVTVSKLAAIIRIADALDTQHASKVINVSVKYKRPNFKIKLQGMDDLLLEKWGFLKRCTFFEEVFGVKVSLDD